MSLRLLLPWFLLLGLALAGCPAGDDDDSAGDDDDATANDDDATDDDDASDDDDSAGPASRCDELASFDEVEPNDASDSAQDIGDAPDTGFCVHGEITCGDYAYDDVDLIRFNLPSDREVRLLVEWDGDNDVDGYLWVADDFQLNGSGFLIGWEQGNDSPEVGSDLVQAGVDHLVQVACYDGEGGSWTVEVTYEPLSDGDDDDSVSDDDDSASDDDDSASDDDDSASDDDDSAATDDDDSASDDDDSAATDDDDSAATDDDDSAATDDDDSAATR